MPRKKTIRVGERRIDEAALLAELERVKIAIETWGRTNQLWHDDGFATPFIYHDDPPRSHETLLLLSEGSIGRICGSDGAFNSYENSFNTMLKGLGYEYEMDNHYTYCLYPADDKLREDFLSLYQWQWLQKLANQKMFELHREVFDHFAKHPEDLQRIAWRQFEELLDAIFKNQGFYTNLGKGGNDGGVDIRLYQSLAAPEVVTLVQAKKYKNPIKLDAVAALFGISTVQRATGSIFCTSSYFEPVAKRFASSVEQAIDLPGIELADASKIAGWCAEIGNNLNRYFTDGVSAPPMIERATGELAGKIVVAHTHINCTRNHFAKIVADFNHEVVLQPIGKVDVSGDGQDGTEMPSESAPVMSWHAERFLAAKQQDGSFWGERKSYSIWDGTPQFFNSD